LGSRTFNTEFAIWTVHESIEGVL